MLRTTTTKVGKLIALIQAAYPQFNAEYHWNNLDVCLQAYKALGETQARLQRLGWHSIEPGIDQTELVINRILISVEDNCNYTLRQQGAYAAYLIRDSRSHSDNTRLAFNPSEQQVMLILGRPAYAYSYSKLIHKLLPGGINFAAVAGFDNQTPTMTYELLEQYRLRKEQQMEALLKGPLSPLLLITGAV